MEKIEKLLASLERAEVKVADAKSKLVDELIDSGHWQCLSPNITAVRRVLKEADKEE